MLPRRRESVTPPNRGDRADPFSDMRARAAPCAGGASRRNGLAWATVGAKVGAALDTIGSIRPRSTHGCQNRRHDAPLEHAGSFKRKSDAVLRRNFLISMMVTGKADEIRSRLRSTDAADGFNTVRPPPSAGKASRVDVVAGTAQTYKVALARILPRLGEKPLEEIDVAAVTDLVAEADVHARDGRGRTRLRRADRLGGVQPCDRRHARRGFPHRLTRC